VKPGTSLDTTPQISLIGKLKLAICAGGEPVPGLLPITTITPVVCYFVVISTARCRREACGKFDRRPPAACAAYHNTSILAEQIRIPE
jgi:hypothetical protein